MKLPKFIKGSGNPSKTTSKVTLFTNGQAKLLLATKEICKFKTSRNTETDRINDVTCTPKIQNIKLTVIKTPSSAQISFLETDGFLITKSTPNMNKTAKLLKTVEKYGTQTMASHNSNLNNKYVKTAQPKRLQNNRVGFGLFNKKTTNYENAPTATYVNCQQDLNYLPTKKPLDAIMCKEKSKNKVEANYQNVEIQLPPPPPPLPTNFSNLICSPKMTKSITQLNICKQADQVDAGCIDNDETIKQGSLGKFNKFISKTALKVFNSTKIDSKRLSSSSVPSTSPICMNVSGSPILPETGDVSANATYTIGNVNNNENEYNYIDDVEIPKASSSKIEIKSNPQIQVKLENNSSSIYKSFEQEESIKQKLNLEYKKSQMKKNNQSSSRPIMGVSTLMLKHCKGSMSNINIYPKIFVDMPIVFNSKDLLENISESKSSFTSATCQQSNYDHLTRASVPSNSAKQRTSTFRSMKDVKAMPARSLNPNFCNIQVSPIATSRLSGEPPNKLCDSTSSLNSIQYETALM